jgi:hypothetical protein
MNIDSVDIHFSESGCAIAVEHIEARTFSGTASSHYSHEIAAFFNQIELVECLLVGAREVIGNIFCTVNNFLLVFLIKVGVKNITIKYRIYFASANACSLSKNVGATGYNVLAVEVNFIGSEIADKEI